MGCGYNFLTDPNLNVTEQRDHGDLTSKKSSVIRSEILLSRGNKLQ